VVGFQSCFALATVERSFLIDRCAPFARAAFSFLFRIALFSTDHGNVMDLNRSDFPLFATTSPSEGTRFWPSQSPQREDPFDHLCPKLRSLGCLFRFETVSFGDQKSYPHLDEHLTRPGGPLKPASVLGRPVVYSGVIHLDFWSDWATMIIRRTSGYDHRGSGLGLATGWK